MDLTIRPRRLRTSAKLRKMVRETRMDKSSLVYPMFVMDGENKKEEIPTMPGQFRYTLDRMPEILQEMADAGVGSVMLFGIPDHKDEVGSGAYACDGIIQRALEKAKKEVPDLYYIGDVCMCEYTSHGHCGILKGDYVDNDLTLDKLAQIAVSPQVFGMIFADAFDFRSILGGVSGSCLMFGVKRGLFSNEAGVGSAPNAAASADVSHPVKQGLVQMLSVFIDTLLICTATAMMCLASGTPITKEIAGAGYVQNAVTVAFGSFGPILITVCMVLFAFSTLIGNFFYVDNCLIFIHKKEPGKSFMTGFRILASLVIFVGAGMSMAAAWDIADILMALMCLINIPACLVLGGTAVKVMKDYERQKREGRDPVFRAADVGLDLDEVEYWK